MNLIGVNNPVRLLREKWRDPVALSQELYAMFTAKGPTELDDTLTISVPEGKPALRIVQTRASAAPEEILPAGRQPKGGVPSQPPDGPAKRQRVTDLDPRQRNRATYSDPGPRPLPDPASVAPGRDSPPRRAPDPTRAVEPLVEIDGPVRFSGPSPVQFTQTPVFVDPSGRQRDFLTAIRDDPGLVPNFVSAGGGKNWLGRVTGGTFEDEAGTYWEIVLKAGGETSADEAATRVYIPYIDPTEPAPIGMVVGPIFKAGPAHYFQPPVWIDDADFVAGGGR